MFMFIFEGHIKSNKTRIPPLPPYKGIRKNKHLPGEAIVFSNDIGGVI